MPRPKFSDRYQPIVEWAEKNIYLDPNSPIPGRIKLFPWQKPILEAYTDHKVRQVSLMLSSQIGKSVLFAVIMFYHVDNSPVNMLLVEPTEKLYRRFRQEKIEPILEASPRINRKMHRTTHGTIPMDEIPYDGGIIFAAYSGSPSSLRQLSAALTLADEVDVYKGNLDTANPISIIWQRGRAFGERRKMVVASTPTSAGSSLIEQEFNDGSQGYYLLPCPHCELEHQLEWDNILNSRLYCPGCGAEIEEEQRISMLVKGGRWHEEKPNVSHKSYHINQLYTVEDSLANIVDEYDDKNPRGFWTQVLGKPFRSADDSTITPDGIKSLYSKEWDLGDGVLNENDANAITAAVDIQKNRLELGVVWWKDWTPRVDKLIRIPVIETQEDIAWTKLNQELMAVNPDMVFIDRHYPSPDEVKAWADKHCSYWISMKRMWLIVGSENTFGEPFIKKYPTPKEQYYASLSVDTAKEWIHSIVKNKILSINSEGVPSDFAEQLSAEELRYTVTATGRETQRWVKTHRENEALDLMVYNACARRALGEDYSRQSTLTWEDLTELMTPE